MCRWMPAKNRQGAFNRPCDSSGRERQPVTGSHQERDLRYLLGKMSDQELAEFESQCFADNEIFEEMSGLENDLIDSYVRDELSAGERQEFEKGYLTSPARRANVQFARALAGHLSDAAGSAATQPQPFPDTKSAASSFFSQTPIVRIAMGALTVALLAATTGLMVANRQLHREIDSLQAHQAESLQKEQALRRQIADLNTHHRETTVPTPHHLPQPDIISLVLTPGMGRSSGEPKALVLPPATLMVRLQLLIAHDDYPAYQATVETAEGSPDWRKKGIKSQTGREGARSVTLGVPPEVFKPGDYLVKLSGITSHDRIEDVEDYRFVVAR